ncbi:SDR family oxidoreductase [soil metagenome]
MEAAGGFTVTMRILVLGGTAWLGSEIVRVAVERGHEVTALARGESGSVPPGAAFVAADRERDDAFTGVSTAALTDTATGTGTGTGTGTDWDAVIDVARQPGQVRRAIEALAARTAHWVYVSSASVYADTTTIGADESAPIKSALVGDVMESMETYGEAKVACENLVLEGMGAEHVLIARASLIGGPGDWSSRSGYWPWRFARPSNDEGRVLIPDTPDVPVQVLDARDLASWLVTAAERRTAGIATAGGETHTFAEHLEVARTVTGFSGALEVVGEDWLAEHGVEPWAGPRSLPLWLPAETIALNGHDVTRAAELGLRTRPLADTLRDALAWELERSPDTERRAGLTDADERELLAELI